MEVYGDTRKDKDQSLKWKLSLNFILVYDVMYVLQMISHSFQCYS